MEGPMATTMTTAEALRLAGEGNPLPQGEPGEEHEYTVRLEATANVRGSVPAGKEEMSGKNLLNWPGYMGQVQLGRALDSARQSMQIVGVEHAEGCPCRTATEAEDTPERRRMREETEQARRGQVTTPKK